MMKDTNLICTKCKKTFQIDQVYPRCTMCGEPLEIEKVTGGTITEGNTLHQTIMERYADFFPFSKTDKLTSLQEGFTPLVESSKLASELQVKTILLKNESQNPTWSFKDRGTVSGIQHALSLGYEKIGTVSSGNMAVSVAAYGARAGLKTFVLVSATLPPEKLNPIAMYDPVLIKVDGDYGQLYFDSLEIGRKYGIYFINSDVPFRVEGSKTIAFEICEQMNFEIPDFVVVPTSSGGNMRGIIKGFEEFQLCGLTGKVPRIICAQASGCSPIYKAYAENRETISRFQSPDTIAHAIENPFPPSGNEALRKIKENGGFSVVVTDDEILQAQKRLAKEGVFVQPAAAVPLAAVKKLRNKNILDENCSIVCIITGGGLKYTAIFERHNLKTVECTLENLDKLVGETDFLFEVNRS
ncbi:MAG: threonine synthase [Syntrophales bacterium]|nr:threonine synthase [Syntrophales bacterium]